MFSNQTKLDSPAMDFPARQLWNAFVSRSLGGKETSLYEALYSPFVVCLASGDLEPKRFNRHVAGVLQILEAMGTMYQGALESIADSGHDSISLAIADLYASVKEDYKALSSELEGWKLDASQYSETPIDYCSYLQMVGVTSSKGPLYAAHILASTAAFMSLSAFLAKRLEEISDPKYLYWIKRYASEKFQESSKQTEIVLNDLCELTGLSGNNFCFSLKDKFAGHYMRAMRGAVEFFVGQENVEECWTVPLIREHYPGRELIVVYGLDSSCCHYMLSKSYEEFTSHVQSVLPIVKVGYVHENVLEALSKIDIFRSDARGNEDIDEIKIFYPNLDDLVTTIYKSKNTNDVSIHLLLASAKYDRLKSALSSESMNHCIMYTNLGSNAVKLKQFMELSRKNSEKVLSIYVGDGIDDLGCLLEADIGIVPNPCLELRCMSTQFGVSYKSLWEVTVTKQKQMREGIQSLWRPRSGVLYTVEHIDEIAAFMFGALNVDPPKSQSERREELRLGLQNLPKPKNTRKSVYSNLAEERPWKPEMDRTRTNPKKATPPKTKTFLQDVQNSVPPSKNKRLSVPLILPKPKNPNPTINVQKRSSSENKGLPLALNLPKPKNQNPAINVQKRSSSENKGLPLALNLPKPKNQNPAINVQKRKGEEEDVPLHGNKEIEEEDVQVDGKEQAGKEKDEAVDENEEVEKEEDSK